MDVGETIPVRLGNARQTSAGYAQPGEVHELPTDEARELLAAGHATRADMARHGWLAAGGR